MTIDDEDRIKNPHRSKGAKIGWKKHRSNYMRANRKKSRDYMNKTFYGLAKQLAEYLNEEQKDDVFNLEFQQTFDNLSGGISFSINKETGEVSFSTFLQEDATSGNYKILNQGDDTEELNALYADLKDEISSIVSTIDSSIIQVLAKHGLKKTY